MRRLLVGICALAIGSAAPPLRAETLHASPANYAALLRQLKPGDTLNLEPGTYPRLYLAGINGTSEAWIAITGPASDPPAIIQGEPDHNTVEIEHCSYLSLENLRIDSRGIPGAFGISARGREHNLTHHIRIEGNTLIGQHGGQQTDGISTKTPTWGWVIRYNKILGAGTGLYLGDSDGSQPFVDGVIENNLIQDTIGYDMEIKDQHSIPAMPGMPLGPTSTLIRNNVFIKNDRASPDGDRPNLLVGAFPENGPGSLNMYEIYGNYFVHNHREALFQGSGRLSLHDNIFIDGPYTYPAVVLRKQNGPLQVALVYNNTVYTSGPGIRFDHPALSGGAVVGNLVFATNPIAGPIAFLSDNTTGSLESAPAYVHSPAFDLAVADFYPLPGKCQGAPLDLTMFQGEKDYTLDFNGTPKTQTKGAPVFRGAYAGEGPNPGWHGDAGLKPPYPPRPKTPRLAWVSFTAAKRGAAAQLTLTGANFGPGATVSIGGDGLQVSEATVNSETEITATLTMAAGASFGTRDVTVTTSAGASNTFKFRVGAGRRQP
jgi:hypothetical protein